MVVTGRTAALVTALLALGLASVAGARTTADPPSATEPVPSLTPVATKRLWNELVANPEPQAFARASACAPVRVVVYAATDWLRVATKLAASPSPCAQYYVSIPPLAGNKSQPRSDQAWRIRALGPAFHAAAEINVTGWTSWVSTTGSTWYAAGVEARRRIDAAGYDVAAGDIWALNEISSAVRQGTGSARQNMRDFLDGLYDGDGVLPVSRGAVFVIGFAQDAASNSVYQSRLQDWYGDQQFWTAMARDVGDWQQEVFGDVRKYAVPGASREARRDALNEYLQHPAALAAAAPANLTAAKAFVGATYGPLANAAWQWDASYGFTHVPFDLMQDFVTAQVYAARSAANGRFGFAWQPNNLDSLLDGGLQRPDRRDPRAARLRDRGLVGVARGRVRDGLVQPQPRRRELHHDLAQLLDLDRGARPGHDAAADDARLRADRDRELDHRVVPVHRRRDRLRLRVLARLRALHAVHAADGLHGARGRVAPLRGARRRSVGQRRREPGDGRLDDRSRRRGRPHPAPPADPGARADVPPFTAPGTRIPPPGH